MAQTELEQIALAMMMMREDPKRRRRSTNKPAATATTVHCSEETNRKETFTGTLLKVDGGEESYESMEENYCNDMTEESEGHNSYSTGPITVSAPSPGSPAGSLKSSGSSNGGGGGGANSTRRIFTPEFKQRVLDAFTNDPECIGNQRATARKFNIHRRQVQKWLQQQTEQPDLKDQQLSEDSDDKGVVQKEKATHEETETFTENSKITTRSRTSQQRKRNPARSCENPGRRSTTMPIVAGKVPIIPQGSTVSTPAASLPSSSPSINMGKGIGTLHHPLFSNNGAGLFPGLSNSLIQLSGSAEASISRTPPKHSPPYLMNGHSNGSLSSSAKKMLELVDELCYLYPSEDFSLLRKAMLKNEVSFTKLAPSRRGNSRKNSGSPTPTPNDYIAQQTLQMIKSQNEYLQLLQSGYANLSHFQDIANLSTDPKYASWLMNPFAAAAAGLAPQVLKQQGNGSDRKKNYDSDHNFALPKAPVSNPKPKTVAAVIAAARNGSATAEMINSLVGYDKGKRACPRRKNNGRVPRSYPSPPTDDDYLDPTSMLEVVTSKPSPGGDNGEYYGMDLSTSSPKHVKIETVTGPSTIRSKAMSKDYGFLSELGLFRKDGESNGSSPTSNLENFVDNVLPQRKSGSPLNDNNNSNETSTKDSVLEAYSYDPELAGDARAVARKFGLNIRVVQKWIREAPTRSIPSTANGHGRNGDAYSCEDEEDVNENFLQAKTTSSNKRKTTKPNQICDFAEDPEENPLDMVVPIKKRRVSSPTSSQLA